MKTSKETTLFRVLTGSHLYGTATEKSDFDYKAVTLPKLDDLLLNKRVTNRKEKPEGLKAGDKMLAGETETEYLPLQVFFDDFFSGQTYALEVAFATALFKHEPVDNVQFKEYWMWMMQELIDKFLTKSVKKMVGYAVSQSKLYGLKTERYTSMRQFVAMVETHFDNSMFSELTTDIKMRETSLTSSVHADLLESVLRLPFVKTCEVQNASGGQTMAPGLEIAGKKFPFTNSWLTVVNSVKNQLANYGERVKEFDGEGIDWKALSHAIRITEQVLELCRDGKLEFPRPNALYLLDVKSGKVPLDEATAYLNEAFSKVDQAVATSVLPERTHSLETEFEAWKLQKLTELYGLK